MRLTKTVPQSPFLRSAFTKEAERVALGTLGSSVLARPLTWRLLGAWTVAYGLATWAIEAALLNRIPNAPREPFGGVFRLVEAVLWVGTFVIIIAVAERWPIDSITQQWRRVLTQATLGFVLGPVWGTLAYLLSRPLMPAWQSRGVWGIIATEAKGAWFGYTTTALLVHIVLRVWRSEAREVAAAEALRAATDARLGILKLALEPETISRTLDAIDAQMLSDVDAANELLVMLAEHLEEALRRTRVQIVTVRDELADLAAFVQLHGRATGQAIDLRTIVESGVENALIPHLSLPPVVTALLNCGAHVVPVRTISVRIACDDSRLVISAAASMPAVREQDLIARLTASRELVLLSDRLHKLYDDAASVSPRVFHSEGHIGVELVLPSHRPSLVAK